MSDPYIRNITLKYRLAVAIAVLKGKPQDVSLENYIELLRNKINNENSDNFDLTVCSDDFEMGDARDVVIDADDNITNSQSYITSDSITNKQTYNTSDSITILQDYNAQLFNADVEIIENTAHMRQEMTKNTSLGTNVIEETQTTTQEEINLTQIEKAPDLETFCLTQPFPNYQNVVQNSNNENRFNLNEVMKPNEVNLNSNEVNLISDNDHTYYDSQATELYSLHGLTQNYTHVSQSQNYSEIIISDKFLKTKNNIQQHTNTDCLEIASISNDSQNNPNTVKFSENAKRKAEFDTLLNNTKEINLTCTNIEVNEYNPHTILNTVNTAENAKRNSHFNTSSCNDANCDTIGICEPNTISTKDNKNETRIINTNENQLSVQINESFSQYAQDLNDIQMSENTIGEVSENGVTNENDVNEETNENDADSTDGSQIVSFKVVEELNKVKNYINKNVERRLSNESSTDSGYRSDSQTKCSFRSSLQLSGNWLNQSAHSLYEYITECPLLVTTHEIIEEIAQVLGQLVDRLHEEEKYPSFLDEILENINVLLQDLFEGSDGEDVLLRKDEKIQRLLLLNKSVHVQKYTIEKITCTLENLLSHLASSEETYEMTNITQMENTCYIFHLLEILLRRYIKSKNVSSQQSTDSQMEIKKSSITELWRKKWNPNYKEDVIEEFTPRKCVLIKCNEVLNKLIVACMDGYSLIAFAALNCFNILQS